ncbi:MAG: aminopeptidase P N-terminal domain-containing protein [Planctomycetes bacterium]|nr:aminopeptidase P N-terminal domain-containing protein [Planctomycetota bacterium]
MAIHPMFRSHRERLLTELDRRGAAAVLPTSRAKVRNHDAEYRFRPDSDFWWATGFNEPQSVLVLVPGSGERAARSVLFLRERNRDAEIWSGRRLGVERACAELGVDEAYPIAELWTRLPELLKGSSKLMYRAGSDDERDRELFAVLAKLRGQTRILEAVPLEVFDPAVLLHELRLFKDEHELACMRRAAEFTAKAHIAAMKAARPGCNESEIEALVEYEFRRHGADGPAYGSIVAGGANACILHYVENNCVLREGELLLIDAGAESAFYACDVTRTFPIGGRFNAEQRAVYEIVLDAQLAALAVTKPGVRFDAVHRCALERLVQGLCSLGVLEGPPEKALESESYKRFYMHRTSHWLGLDVHDSGAYVSDGLGRVLEPGMVLTIEPGLYLAPDDETLESRWRGIGIRIEDDVLVTATGAEVLTSAIPKTVADIERICARG